jgi:hypothetical protein
MTCCHHAEDDPQLCPRGIRGSCLTLLQRCADAAACGVRREITLSAMRTKRIGFS